MLKEVKNNNMYNSLKLKLVEIVLNYPNVIENILKDHSTLNNIIWANINDEHKYHSDSQKEINIEDVIENKYHRISNGNGKSIKEKNDRKKENSEVFTPSWICNFQNNLIDESWFGYENVFNKTAGNRWITNKNKIKFNNKKWQDYVTENRMEVACGEAPFLVNRYDSTTGEEIKIEDRIGLLDRKLRIINENTTNKRDWTEWTIKAYQSCYGFELQGDNLLIARINLLITLFEYFENKFGNPPNIDLVTEISIIISWNIFQMDAQTLKSPLKAKVPIQLSIFDDTKLSNETVHFSKIKDWKSNDILLYGDLIKRGSNGRKI